MQYAIVFATLDECQRAAAVLTQAGALAPTVAHAMSPAAPALPDASAAPAGVPMAAPTAAPAMAMPPAPAPGASAPPPPTATAEPVSPAGVSLTHVKQALQQFVAKYGADQGKARMEQYLQVRSVAEITVDKLDYAYSLFNV